MYHIPAKSGITPEMVQPKQPPVSIRISDDLKARVAKFAETRKITRNAAYAQLLEAGLVGGEAAKPAKVPTIRNTSRVKSEPMLNAMGEPVTYQGAPLYVDVPLVGTFKRGPIPKGPKK